MIRPPLAGAAVWQAVVDRCGARCECQGACGKKHADPKTKQPGRCETTNGQRSTKRGIVTLIATPRDPVNESSFHVAASLPAHRLIGLCPDCYDGIRRIFKRAARALPPQDDGLFGVEEYYVAPASKRQADVGAA